MSSLIDRLTPLADPERAAGIAQYHKANRRYLGVPVPILNDMAKAGRQDLTLEDRIAQARALWETDIHEARVLAAKLLTQARIRPDAEVWALIQSWVPEFDAWAIADHACTAGQKRLIADPTRLDIVERWATSDHLWTKRAALVITLPWAKMPNPKPHELVARDRILGWAASYVADRNWFIQKSVAWWLRDLSKHDPDRARTFLAGPGADLKAFARKEAAKYLT